MPKRWKKIRETEIKVGYKKVTTRTFSMPDDSESDFTLWGRSGAQNVATIAVTKDKKVLIARQFRPGPEEVLDELPGGGVDPGEDLATAAARELKEETGYMTDEPLEYLGKAYHDAYTAETHNYFLARNCYRQSAQQLGQNEYVDIVKVSISELIETAKSGMNSDAVAVFQALEQLRTFS